jgi:phosphopantetheine adenylyltransferase
LFDKIIAGVAHNVAKTYFFKPEKRVYLIKESLKELKKPYIDEIPFVTTE